MLDKNIFGSRIKSLRKQYSMSQSALAELLGVSKTQISDLENGKTTTNLDRLVILSNHFNTSCDYLLGLTDNPVINK